jgi:hypothetical protein
VHHWRLREPRWQLGLTINAAGATATAIVLIVVLASKLTSGAWVPAVVIPIITVGFIAVHRHYSRVHDQLELQPTDPVEIVQNTVIVLVASPTRAAAHAVAYAKGMHPAHLVVVTVVADQIDADRARSAWERSGIDAPLEVLEDPYRDFTEVLLGFIDQTDATWADDTITVVIPEFVVHRWWEHTLHNQSALVLKARLLYRPNTVVTSVPWHID